MQIYKIKTDKKGTIFIKYQVPKNDDKYEKHTLECTDQPLPDFTLAIANLRKQLLLICELPSDDETVLRLQVRGVSFSWIDDRMGATITGLLTLTKRKTPLVINTPHLFEPINSSGEDSAILLPDECVIALKSLIEEAEKYVNGERSQMHLFGESYKKDKKKLG